MKFFIKSIVKNIESQLQKDKGLKILVKIDSFETPEFYFALWKEVKKLTDMMNIELVYKLADEKYEDFKKQDKSDLDYYLAELEANNLLANGTKLTNFRNHTPSKRTLIVLLGTEASQEDGSLQDFYTINVQSIEEEVKDGYCILFNKFPCLSADGQTMINHFYKELFRYVPKNLYKLSCLVDELTGPYEDVEEIINDICLNLAKNWGFVNIGANRITRRELLSKKGIKIFQQAGKFLKRKGFDKLSEIRKNEKKIDKYILDQNEKKEAWPSCYTIKTYDQFKSVMLDYIQGIDTESNRALLAEIDFSYICDALNIKVGREKSKKPDKTIKFNDEPVVVFSKAVLNFLDYLYSENYDVSGEFRFEIESIGISQVIDEREVFSVWENICFVTGGIFEFINRETIKLGEEELKINPVKDYFNSDLANELYNDGVLKKLSATQVLSKIHFDFSTIDNKYKKSYVWEFDPKAEWVLLFQELRDLINASNGAVSYIPFGINSKLSSLLDVRNASEFYENYSNLKIDYQQYNLVELFETEFGNTYSDYYVKYYKLGEAFVEWLNDLFQGGIFSTLSTSAFQFVTAYTKYADYLLENEPTEEFEQSYKLFINAFLISNSADAILNDIDIDMAVIAPYHPAVVEKVMYRFDYIKYGICSIISDFSDNYQDGKLKEALCSIDRLLELSVIDSAVDVLISGSKKITKDNMYGYYTTYCNHEKRRGEDKVLIDMMQRDGIFSEDFNANEYKTLTPLAKVIKGNIKNYLSVFTIAYHCLEIVAINFRDFQDIVSAIHNLIIESERAKIPLGEVKLSILMPVNQQGGQNYLAYWVNSFFDEDSEVKIKIYLNYYKTLNEINNLIPSTTDIVFYNDILKEVEVKFSRNEVQDMALTETRFPMVYRTLPISTTSKKRQIEITQTQFKAATSHAQVVYKIKNLSAYNHSTHLVVREMELDDKSYQIIEELHEKCKWVVCIGIGLDKKLLFNDAKEKEFKIIGFTTGEGVYGEYNVTTSACTSMIEDLKNRLTMKFKRIFYHSSDKVIKQAVDNCIKNVKYLEGVNVLKALNPHDYDINNFIAYFLTNKYFIENKKEADGINVLISLDSYRHWFDANKKNSIDNSASRPDFLQLKIDKIEDDEDIVIKANIIECKFAKQSQEHVDRALGQVEHGYDVLGTIFNSDLESIEKRYWFAQLYRVLTFTEINMMDNDLKFSIISNKLMSILDGKFKIEWSGSVMTYWIDSDINDVHITNLDSSSIEIKQYEFGQKEILKCLSGIDSFDTVFDKNLELDDKEQYEREFKEFEKEEIQESNEVIEDNYKDINQEVAILREGKPEESTMQEVISFHDTTKEEIGAENKLAQFNTEKLENNGVSVNLGLSFNQSERINWNFTDPKMSNRHVLITGKSGQGKTYAIQGMFMELAKQNVPVIIFDYTGGFLPSKLEKEVQQQLGEKIQQQVVRKDKLKVNPFKIQEMELEGFIIPESAVDVSARIRDILVHVYNFGEQQGAAIYVACKNGIEKYKEKMNFNHFKDELLALGTKEAKSVFNKIISFLDYDIFDTENESDWENILYNDGEVTIFQLSLVQSKDMQIAITEMILWDMWYYSVKNGSEEKPFAVVLDEAQNLSFGDEAPTTKILTEGRKFGWSGWFATQFLKGQLKPEEINRLQQAALRIYFKPADDEIQSMANSIDPEKKDINRWIKQLKDAQKGECVVIGDGVYGETKQKTVPVTIKVPSIGERV